MRLPRFRRAGLAAAALVLAAAAPAAAQQSETAAFVVTIGRDTLAVEQYTRTADRLTGEVVSRTPRTVATTYDARLRPDGSVARVELFSRAVADSTVPSTRSTIDFGGDTATVTIRRGTDSVRTVRVAAPANGVPLVNNSYAFYEQALMHFRRAGADSLTLALLPPGANRTFEIKVSRLGADSVLLSNVAGPQRVRVDRAGRLLALSGLESTQKFIVQRLPSANLAALTSEFARRDQAGQGFGFLSPRDTVMADIGGARVTIHYGRPYKRGRRVMGEVVPWNQVWRTGANQATHLTTELNLQIGSAVVPAGTYTVWTLPSPQGWKLIINRQTGQWGTEYHAEQDLARVDMTRRTLPEPVEQFTISIDPQGNGGVLRMAWDDTEVSVPFTTRQ